MNRPLLQLALDNTSLASALASLEGVDEVVDIIECGTILIGAEGAKVIKTIRDIYPNKLLVADFKIADSGNVMGGLMLEGKPDFLTVICAAHINTMKAVKDEIEKRDLKTEVQIELYGNWTFEEVRKWKEIGINQVILHHSRDIKGGWSKEEIDIARKLCEEGMKVTVTGSIGYEDIDLFKDLPIYCIICGRSIRDAKDPKDEALKMKKKLEDLWL